uniref:Uncharacterized protein n=1 Tax=Felis catus TaxID=9685 RepID=A0ABI7W4H5_FELCA
MWTFQRIFDDVFKSLQATRWTLGIMGMLLTENDELRRLVRRCIEGGIHPARRSHKKENHKRSCRDGWSCTTEALVHHFLVFRLCRTFHMGMTGPVNWLANLSSSAKPSPSLGADGFLGKRMSLEPYSFSHFTLACRDSVDVFHLLGLTEIPMVHATFLCR